jgi:hypothetical protein
VVMAATEPHRLFLVHRLLMLAAAAEQLMQVAQVAQVAQAVAARGVPELTLRELQAQLTQAVAAAVAVVPSLLHTA